MKMNRVVAVLLAGIFLGSVGELPGQVGSEKGSIKASGKVVQKKAKAKLTPEDRLLISVQKICPVMGAELGSMGTPLKTEMKGQTVFLCCKGCLGKEPKEKHWNAMMARFAKAQGKCPVMGKAIKGDSKFTVSQGLPVFICCPPCTDTIKEEPKDTHDKLMASYNQFVVAEGQKASDKVQIAVQKICPVSGKPLGSMGDPIKVKVGKHETAFLCCKGCVGGKIKAEHWKTVQQNIVAAQKTCPMMGKPVSLKSKSFVVGGRKIFVCCAKCVKMGEKNPAFYLQKTNELVQKGMKKGTEK